ncbi:hypothetical protein QR680_001747 [Steinernema hermaphroditum]|uniref:Uncharacterized protein n=1 Tax=Steinernema hermaphroditum TaxID=289476 RepID=A0AA39GZT4_9BILA|nr:hypothetical protein QR680_001747 [Steinernema hermaphroditum]
MARADDEEPFLSDGLEDIDEEFDEGAEQRRIVLHVYDDESKEFTSLTTYHGMVRIYNSNTWPSLIFWCLVVVTCVTLFMIHSGMLLYFYLSHPTFLQETVRVDDGMHFPFVTVCLQPTFQSFTDSEQNCLRKILFGGKSACGSEGRLLESEYNRSLSLRKLLFDSGRPAIKVFVGGKDVSDRVSSRRLLTKHGICESLNVTQLFPLSYMSVVVENTTADVLYNLQSQPKASHLDSEGIHVRPGKHSFTTFKIVGDLFLQKGDRGFCRPNSDIVECTQRCQAKTYLKKCKCLPFYMTDAFDAPECSLLQIRDCVTRIEKPTDNCDCLVGCRRTNYRIVTTTYARLSSKSRNSSVITLKQNNRLRTEFRQLKRFRTVDLLSFVAGSMGLFLGMSCVTLMEIFMYLFKSIWGMVNNSRHKEFLEKLLGETVENLVDESDGKELKRSHEEIVITVNGRNDNEIITVDHEALGNRRLSIIPFNRSRIDKAMFDSKWQLAVPPRLESTRSRASTLDSRFSFEHNQ